MVKVVPVLLTLDLVVEVLVVAQVELVDLELSSSVFKSDQI